MQQRQLRLGDILDDYCPRERRLTNHAVVAMIGDDVKQTRCTTCDAEHEYKHAKVPRQRRKSETPAALYAQVLPADRNAWRTKPIVEPTRRRAVRKSADLTEPAIAAPAVEATAPRRRESARPGTPIPEAVRHSDAGSGSTT